MWSGRVFLLLCLAVLTVAQEDTIDEDAPTEHGNDKISYEGYQLITVSPETKKQKKAVIKLSGKEGVHFWLAQKNATGQFYAQILLAPNAISRVTRRLRDKGVNFRVVLQDLQSTISTEVATTRDADSQLATHGHALSWNKYHRLADIHAYMRHVADVHPDVAELQSIGRSTEGHDLLVLKLGRKTKQVKPSLWIDGGVHAREWISPAVVTYLVKELLSDRPLLDRVDLYLLPVLNPDGYEFSHTKDRLWRKTRSLQRAANISAPLRQQQKACYGVDANRNWDSHWGERAGAKDPCSHNFPGPRAFSEPETRAVADTLLKIAPSAYITLHSYSQLWLMPWGFTDEPSVHDLQLRRVALKAVEAIQNKSGKLYVPGSIHSTLYPISGSSMDWAHEKAGIRYAFLVELRDKGDFGFVLPPSEIEPTGQEMLAAVKVVAQAAFEDPSQRARKLY